EVRDAHAGNLDADAQPVGRRLDLVEAESGEVDEGRGAGAWRLFTSVPPARKTAPGPSFDLSCMASDAEAGR
ncbi:MAG TPA: hypothetical protein PLY73_01960, partial [Candidatus Ozemobacteraceae bacterium]|nr:hypothetical protein [Candidatus Ozemobacteraceae bacterium]